MALHDARTVRGNALLAAFNAMPDLVSLKHVRTSLLRMTGVDVPIRGTHIRSPQYIEPFGQIHVGHGTFINARCHFDTGADIFIGIDCNIGPSCNFECTNHRGATHRNLERRAIRIGDRVWLGAAVTVLPGARIDDDTIVAAGAVVHGHLAGGGLWGGVPARRIREADGPVSIAPISEFPKT